jgi:hypothetical protein
MVMTFGMYKGRLVTQVPSDYLQWVLRKCDCAEPALREAIRDELVRRGEPPGRGRRRRDRPGDDRAAAPCPKCERVGNAIARQFRRLALVAHPDRGGSDAVMAAVNSALEELREVLR